MTKTYTKAIEPILLSITSLHQLIITFRVHNTRSMILFYLLGVKLSTQPFHLPDILFISLSFIFSYAFASILNFHRDRLIDALNQRSVPAIFKSLSSGELQYLSIGTVMCALILMLPTQSPLYNLVAITFHLILSYAYSHPLFPLSFHPLGKSVSMWAGYLLIPGLIGLGSNPSFTQLHIIFWISFYYASWQLFNDIKDIKGDKKFGKNTLAVILGARKLTALSLLIGLLSLHFFHGLMQFPNTLFSKFLTLNYLILLTFQIIVIFYPSFIHQKNNRQFAGYLLLTSLLLLILSI